MASAAATFNDGRYATKERFDETLCILSSELGRRIVPHRRRAGRARTEPAAGGSVLRRPARAGARRRRGAAGRRHGACAGAEAASSARAVAPSPPPPSPPPRLPLWLRVRGAAGLLR